MNEADLNTPFVLSYLGFSLVMYLASSYFLGRVFKKLNESAWKAWVPVYNFWVFLGRGGQPPWIAFLSLLFLFPILNNLAAIVVLVYMALAAQKLGKGFDKASPWWVVLFVLVPIAWLAIVAFDNKPYNPNAVLGNPNYAPEQSNGGYTSPQQGYGPPPQATSYGMPPQQQTYGPPPVGQASNQEERSDNPYISREITPEAVPEDQQPFPPKTGGYKRPVLDEKGNRIDS
jgi:hypothetical protein